MLKLYYIYYVLWYLCCMLNKFAGVGGWAAIDMISVNKQVSPA